MPAKPLSSSSSGDLTPSPSLPAGRLIGALDSEGLHEREHIAASFQPRQVEFMVASVPLGGILHLDGGTSRIRHPQASLPKSDAVVFKPHASQPRFIHRPIQLPIPARGLEVLAED